MSRGAWSRPYPGVAVLYLSVEYNVGLRGQRVESYRAEVARVEDLDRVARWVRSLRADERSSALITIADWCRGVVPLHYRSEDQWERQHAKEQLAYVTGWLRGLAAALRADQWTEYGLGDSTRAHWSVPSKQHKDYAGRACVWVRGVCVDCGVLAAPCSCGGVGHHTGGCQVLRALVSA